jgi:hypothetical protein
MTQYLQECAETQTFLTSDNIMNIPLEKVVVIIIIVIIIIKFL